MLLRVAENSWLTPSCILSAGTAGHTTAKGLAGVSQLSVYFKAFHNFRQMLPPTPFLKQLRSCIVSNL